MENAFYDLFREFLSKKIKSVRSGVPSQNRFPAFLPTFTARTLGFWERFTREQFFYLLFFKDTVYFFI